MSDGDDRMTDRGKRWASEIDADESGENSDREESGTSSKSDSHSESGDRWVSVENVKSEYPARQFYLNPAVIDRLDEEYNRLQYMAEFDFGKDRHFYPAVAVAGIERIAEMEGDEFRALLERVEQDE